MEPFVIFLIVVITILTTILTIAGIQVILILKNINHTLTKANRTIDLTESFVTNLVNPLSDLRSLGDGVKTGMHVASHIVDWVQQRRSKQTPVEADHE